MPVFEVKCSQINNCILRVHADTALDAKRAVENGDADKCHVDILNSKYYDAYEVRNISNYYHVYRVNKQWGYTLVISLPASELETMKHLARSIAKTERGVYFCVIKDAENEPIYSTENMQ